MHVKDKMSGGIVTDHKCFSEWPLKLSSADHWAELDFCTRTCGHAWSWRSLVAIFASTNSFRISKCGSPRCLMHLHSLELVIHNKQYLVLLLWIQPHWHVADSKSIISHNAFVVMSEPSYTPILFGVKQIYFLRLVNDILS